MTINHRTASENKWLTENGSEFGENVSDSVSCRRMFSNFFRTSFYIIKFPGTRHRQSLLQNRKIVTILQQEIILKRFFYWITLGLIGVWPPKYSPKKIGQEFRNGLDELLVVAHTPHNCFFYRLGTVQELVDGCVCVYVCVCTCACVWVCRAREKERWCLRALKQTRGDLIQLVRTVLPRYPPLEKSGIRCSKVPCLLRSLQQANLFEVFESVQVWAVRPKCYI